MDRALREFRIRGVKTNIPFLVNVIRHPDFLAGAATTTFIDNTPELFHFAAAARPRHQAAALPRRRHRQRQPGREGQDRPEAQVARAGRAAVRPHGSRRPPGLRRQLLELGPEKFCRVDAASRSGCWSPTPPSATPTSRCSPRACAPTTCCASPRPSPACCPNLFSLEMWGGATFDTAMRFLQEDPWERLRRAARADPEHPVPDAAPRLATPSATPTTRTTSSRGSSSTPPTPGIDIFRIFDSLNWTCRTCRSRWRPCARTRTPSARRPSATPATSSTRTATSIRLKYYVELAKELEKMGAHILAIKDMAGLCKPYAAYELVKALKRGDRHPDPLPHPRHQRHQCRHRARRPPRPAWTSSTPPSPSMSRHHRQPNLNSHRRRPASTRRATPASICDALNEFSDYWEDVREFYYPFEDGIKRRHRRGLSPRDARRPVHQPPRAGQRAGPRPPLARSRRRLRRGQPALRRHRQGHAVVEGRRRHGPVPGHQQPDRQGRPRAPSGR